MYTIDNKTTSGIAVFGYYEINGKVYFTCINQDHTTSTSDFELDFELPWTLAYKHVRGNKNTRIVFVPIINPNKTDLYDEKKMRARLNKKYPICV